MRTRSLRAARKQLRVMAKRGKGKPFTKGVSPNPGGRPKLPDDIVMARRLNQLELERVFNKYLFTSDQEDLVQTIKDTSLPPIHRCVASILYQAIVKGDPTRLNFIIEKLLGKTPEAPKPREDSELVIIEMSNGNELHMGPKSRDVT